MQALEEPVASDSLAMEVVVGRLVDEARMGCILVQGRWVLEVVDISQWVNIGFLRSMVVVLSCDPSSVAEASP